MFKKARIAVLLFILFLVAAGSWLNRQRLTDWQEPLWVVVYPIAGDTTRATQSYLGGLGVDRFAPIEDFARTEARRYGQRLARPVKMILGPTVAETPPAPPYGGSMLAVMSWSLKLRYWAWIHESDDHLGDISVFVVYHDPQHTSRVPHSLGIKEGSIGVVHAFASNDMTQSNNVVIAHELLHTLGATDKYDARTDLPLHPDGFAAPDQVPLYPQQHAEIMAGRISVSPDTATIPRHLNQVMVGPVTAREIGW